MINSKTIKDLKKITKYVSVDVQMKEHTTFHIGGKSTIVEIENLSKLIRVVDYLERKRVPFMVLGNGSNLLVDDNGYDGVFLKMRDGFEQVEVHGQCVQAYAGLGLMRFISLMKEQGLGGLEELSGIPGTLGGGVYMNCGAFGKEISDAITGVLYFENGKFHYKEKELLEFSYRHSWFMGRNAVIVRVDFRLQNIAKNEIENKIKNILKIRRDAQPTGEYSAGSVFKRIDGEPVSKNLDVWGLKGYSIGGAKISEKHAGFIVNVGNASSQNVLDLIQYIRKYYFDKTGVELQTEIKYIRRNE